MYICRIVEKELNMYICRIEDVYL